MKRVWTFIFFSSKIQTGCRTGGSQRVFEHPEVLKEELWGEHWFFWLNEVFFSSLRNLLRTCSRNCNMLSLNGWTAHLDPVHSAWLSLRWKCVIARLSIRVSVKRSVLGGNVTDSRNRLDRPAHAVKSEQRMRAEFFFYCYVILKRPLPKEVCSRANTISVGCAMISQLIFTWQEGMREALDSSAERTESIQDSFSVFSVYLGRRTLRRSDGVWHLPNPTVTWAKSVVKEDKEIN